MFNQLSEIQLGVAKHKAGPLLVLAGAGSGKTTTMMASAFNKIEMGVQPTAILGLTFTNKAAREMRERIQVITGLPEDQLPDFTTFHTFGFRFVLDNPVLCGRESYCTLLDDSDQIRIVKQLLAESSGLAELKPADLIKTYSLLRQKGLSLDNEGLNWISNELGLDEKECLKACLLFSRYEDHKILCNIVDFDDLICLPQKVLSLNEPIAKALAKQYPFILIDEFQDTNRAQYALVHAIAEHHRNIVVVGDDDQSIYSWRGAETGNIRQFVKDYSPYVCRLEENYRSTPEIVAPASALINKNVDRMVKQPYSVRTESGDLPVYESHPDLSKLAHVMSDRIAESIRQGSAPSDIAVLFRTNRLGMLLEPLLAMKGIPYSMGSVRSMYDVQVVRNALSVIRMLANPKDPAALHQVVKMLPGIGAKTVAKIEESILKGKSLGV